MVSLYIKQHETTGLKYFGKCTSRDPLKYRGSGKYWTRHIQKHGKDKIKTLEVFNFESQEEATKFALAFSQKNDIVKSLAWANLVDENALDGTPNGSKFTLEHRANITKALLARSSEVKERIRRANVGKKHSEESKAKIRISSTGRKHSEESKKKISDKAIISHKLKPRSVSDETRIKISKAAIGRIQSAECKIKIGLAHTNKVVTNETKSKQSEKAKSRIEICPVCNQTFNVVTIRRWHGNNCKLLAAK